MLTIYIYIILTYYTSKREIWRDISRAEGEIFHEPKVSEVSRNISCETSLISVIYPILTGKSTRAVEH